jgi:hypothetical protein
VLIVPWIALERTETGHLGRFFGIVMICLEDFKKVLNRVGSMDLPV